MSWADDDHAAIAADEREQNLARRWSGEPGMMVGGYHAEMGYDAMDDLVETWRAARHEPRSRGNAEVYSMDYGADRRGRREAASTALLRAQNGRIRARRLLDVACPGSRRVAEVFATDSGPVYVARLVQISLELVEHLGPEGYQDHRPRYESRDPEFGSSYVEASHHERLTYVDLLEGPTSWLDHVGLPAECQCHGTVELELPALHRDVTAPRRQRSTTARLARPRARGTTVTEAVRLLDKYRAGAVSGQHNGPVDS